MAKISANNISSSSITSTSLDAVVLTNLNTANTANTTATLAQTTAVAAYAAANTNTTALSNLGPVISSITITDSSWNALDDTAANTGGGYCVITGSGFSSSPTVIFGTTSATAVTYVSSTTLRVQIPALAATSYHVYVININGASAIKLNGLTISSFPAWSTSATLANVSSNTVFSNTLSAPSDSSVTYSNTTILPTGFNLLSNGYYYGNISVGADTTYTFDIKATDIENQDTTRTFSLTTTLLPPTYTINYLMVAGGGSGGSGTASPGPWRGGGGGAGGLETGTLTASPGTLYTLSIGAGGVQNTPPGTQQINGSSGSFSSISIGTPAVLFGSVLGGGGGGAGYRQPFIAGNGNPGGSGGGAGGNAPGPSSGGSGYPGQGYPGASLPPTTSGGGGGGAGGAGSGSTAGPGYTWPYTGNTYSIGGTGGPAPTNPGIYGSGGPGESSNSPGQAGRPGVIIFVMPSAKYPGSAPGATVTTPPAAPGMTVVTFTNSGTFTA